MLVQLKVSLIRLFVWRRHTALLLGTLLLAGLGGCKFDTNRPTFTQTALYKKKVRPAEINMMNSNDAINAPSISTMENRANRLPTPKQGDDTLLQDGGSHERGNNGERATGWTGVYDVYWKLNWARKDLLTGNVSHDLDEVITSTRKHCKRLANEFPKLEGMDERLDAANGALDHLDNGLQQMKKLVLLEESGLEWRSLPWGSGEDEMHRYLERMGLVGPAANSSSAVSTSLTENDDSNSAAKSNDARSYTSSRQREAIALALRCERENHASPEELARTEFQDGMRDIIRLRNLCALTYHPVSVAGDSAVITGPLHLEAESATQTPSSFDTINKSIGSGITPNFDPSAPPGQNRTTPFIR